MLSLSLLLIDCMRTSSSRKGNFRVAKIISMSFGRFGLLFQRAMKQVIRDVGTNVVRVGVSGYEDTLFPNLPFNLYYLCFLSSLLRLFCFLFCQKLYLHYLHFLFFFFTVVSLIFVSNTGVLSSIIILYRCIDFAMSLV